MRVTSFSFVFCLVVGQGQLAFGQTSPQRSAEPSIEAAWVAQSETAIEIGKAVLRERLSARTVEAREPFKAELSSQGIWTVYGSPRASTVVGGGVYIRLRKSNGEILDYGAMP